MSPLLSLLNGCTKRSGACARTKRRRSRLTLEHLEDRAVPTVTLSVSDATATEGDASFRYIDDFVPIASGGLNGPREVLFGPDRNGDEKPDHYVASKWTNQVLSYDGITGAFLGVVIDSNAGCLGPWAMALGPDGNLYVGGGDSNNVIRYTFSTGVTDEYVPAGSGGLIQPRGLTFGPDGHLYVSCPTPRTIAVYDEVLRFQGPSGAQPGAALPAPGQPRAVFIPNGSGGANAMNVPKGSAFGPDGNLYVGNGGSHSINRYDGTTGAFLGVFVPAGSGGLNNPYSLVFRPDGRLYVTSQNNAQVLRYDASTGAFVDAVVPAVPNGAGGLAFDGQGSLYVGTAGNNVLRYGPAALAAFTVSLSSASAAPVTVTYATANGTAIDGSDYTAVTGTLTFAPGETVRTVIVPTLDDSAGEPTETFVLDLSNPSGATITDGQGTGTIIDTDATKYFVVDDASPDRTYRYGAQGNAQTNSTLTTANTAPRGAGSTVAGDKVWVVDVNKKVYVYNAAGALLGSWTAGSLASNAQVEGIATNGTDVWIVDNKQGKVFKYTGAATRLSGSQNAASSFALASGNGQPRDLVTDGASLWVVNDAANDKVFKYSLTGAALGNWTLTGGGGAPTGLTLDPSAPSHLWVVDSATDRVYQYDAAVGRTSGSQAASTSFALAAGNTNPQGIADPPAPGLFLAETPALVLAAHNVTPIADLAAFAPSVAATPATHFPGRPALPPAFLGIGWAGLTEQTPPNRSEGFAVDDPRRPHREDLFAGLSLATFGPDPAAAEGTKATRPAVPRRMPAGGAAADGLAALDQVFAGGLLPAEQAP